LSVFDRFTSLLVWSQGSPEDLLFYFSMEK